METFQNQGFCDERADVSVAGSINGRLSLKRKGLLRLPERNVDWQGPISVYSEPLSVSNPQIFPQAAAAVGNLYFHAQATIFAPKWAPEKQKQTPRRLARRLLECLLSGGVLSSRRSLPRHLPWGCRFRSFSSSCWLRRRRRNTRLHVVGVDDFLGDVAGVVRIEHRSLLL